MRILLIIAIALALNACTFGVRIGSGPVSASVSTSSSPSRNSGKQRGGSDSYVVFGRRYYVMDSASGFVEKGTASWYGRKFHGRPTASGEIYNMHDMTAAHKSLPLPTWVRVRNLDNGKSVVVKVNDRGPFVDDRIIDMSYGAAKRLDMIGPGTARVEVVALESPSQPAPMPQPRVVAKAAAEPDPEEIETAPVVVNTYTDESPVYQGVRASPLQGGSSDNEEIFIQLGSFSSEVNAVNMRSELQDQDENSIVITQVDTDQGAFYRVLLGPLLDVDEAVSIQKRLKRKGYDLTRILFVED